MAKKKSLQKVTDIKNINTRKQLREFINDNPEKNIIKSLLARMNNSYAKKLGEEDKLMNLIEELFLITKGKDNSDIITMKNVTYETNHTIITSFIHNNILENNCFPNIQNISKNTGLSRQTIYKHLNSGLKNKYNDIVKGKLEYMTLNAMAKLYLIGVQDHNATALKHFIELSKTTSQNNTTNINNYIQINNLKLSRDEFNQLPNETILEIETLISKTLSK